MMPKKASKKPAKGEVGMGNASKKAMKADEYLDKKLKIKEGSPEDLRKDKMLKKTFPKGK